MRKLTLLSCAALFGVAMSTSVSAAKLHNVPTNRAAWKPIFTTLPARGITKAMFARQVPGQSTIPYFTSQIKSPLDGNTYQFSIAGTNPVTNKVSTTIQYVPIIMRVHFPDGTVLDPFEARL